MTQKKFPVFAERFSILRGDMTQAEFADFLGLSRPTIGFYENGIRIPDVLVLKQIGEKCKVSSDWLIGLSDTKDVDADMRRTCEYTGLSEDAVTGLRKITLDGEQPNVAHIFVEELLRCGVLKVLRRDGERCALLSLQSLKCPVVDVTQLVGEREAQIETMLAEAKKPIGEANPYVEIRAAIASRLYSENAKDCISSVVSQAIAKYKGHIAKEMLV